MRRFVLCEDFFPSFRFEGDEGGNGGAETTTTETTTTDGGKTYTEAEVKALRKEAADYRTKLREAEKAINAKNEADLTEAQKLAKRAEDAEAKITASQQRVARAEAKVEAAKLNIINPETAYKLIKDEIEFDKDGEPTNLETLLSTLVKENPYLVKGETAGGGNPGNPAGGRGGKLSKEAIQKLARENPNEFNKRYNAGEFAGVL